VQRLSRATAHAVSPNFRFISDDPLKALGKESGLAGSDVLATLGPLLKASQSSVTIISPTSCRRRRHAEAGRHRAVRSAVRVLTNSLAANDVAMVYGGYSKSRPSLLEGGVQLWELKPTTGSATKSSFFGSSGASLHTKALAVDGRIAFVAATTSTALHVAQLRAGRVRRKPGNRQATRGVLPHGLGRRPRVGVTLQDGQLQWSDGTATYDSSPEASAGRRFQAWLARVLPIDSQL